MLSMRLKLLKQYFGIVSGGIYKFAKTTLQLLLSTSLLLYFPLLYRVTHGTRLILLLYAVIRRENYYRASINQISERFSLVYQLIEFQSCRVFTVIKAGVSVNIFFLISFFDFQERAFISDALQSGGTTAHLRFE